MCTRRTILCKVANDEDGKNYDASWRFDWNDIRGLFSFYSFNMCTVCTHYDDNFGLYIVSCCLVFQIAQKYSLARLHVWSSP